MPSIAAVAASRQDRNIFKWWDTPLPDWMPGDRSVPVDPDSAIIVARLHETIHNLAAIAGAADPFSGPVFGPRSSLYITPDGPRSPAPVDWMNNATDQQTVMRSPGISIPGGAIVELPASDQNLSNWDPVQDYYAEMIWAAQGIGQGPENNQQTVYEPMMWIATALTAGTGGSLAAGAHSYKVTATSAAGETTPTVAQALTVSANAKITLKFAARYLAKTYRIFCKRPGQATWTLLATLGPTDVSTYTVTWVDTGASSPDGATQPPATNTADTPEWRCGAGSVMNGVSQNVGRFETHTTGPQSPQGSAWGASASQIPYIAGLITSRDWIRGEIDHVCSMSLPGHVASLLVGVACVGPAVGTNTFTYAAHGLRNGQSIRTYAGSANGITNGSYYYVINKTTNTFQLSNTLNGSAIDITADIASVNMQGWNDVLAVGRWAYPAQSTDGLDTRPDAIPIGARFRMPLSVAEPNWLALWPTNDAATALQRRWAGILFKQLQRYGQICTDSGGGMTWHCRSATSDGTGWMPSTQQAHDIGVAIPWEDCEVVKQGWTG